MVVTGEEALRESQRSESEFGFHTYVSDMISLTRTIPDIRPAEWAFTRVILLWTAAKRIPLSFRFASNEKIRDNYFQIKHL